MLPTYFLSHGGPPLVLDTSDATNRFLAGLAGDMRPKAIVMVSAHFESWGRFEVSAAEHPGMIYDFGFPDRALYEIKYPAPGAPELAARIVEMGKAADLPIALNADRGFDHGTWCPLYLMFPEADIPVVTLSVGMDLTPDQHLALGEALAPLREEGVLIIGSGNATHNLMGMRMPHLHEQLHAASVLFTEWMDKAIATSDTQSLTHYLDSAPYALANHPTPDHMLPLYVPLGAAKGQPGQSVHDAYTYRFLSMSAYRWD